MATSKLIKPTNVTVSIPAFTDQPDQRVNSNCIDKSIDGINTLSDQIANSTTSYTGYVVEKFGKMTIVQFNGGSVTNNQVLTLPGYPRYNVWNTFIDETTRKVVRCGIATDGKLYLRSVDDASVISSIAQLTGQIAFVCYP